GTSDNIDPVTGENYKKVFPQGIRMAPGVDPFAALNLSEKQYKRVQAAQAENERRNEERRAGASRERRFHMP
ncbi:MAG: hypothetical protein JW741_02230, partial [Sedimentisphaerales bacterium]|nr:hypothetical protein [Sedimentisphaerales bacterium]